MDTSITTKHLPSPWRDPNSAPRDGTVVIVCRHNAARACLAFVNEDGEWEYLEDWPRDIGGVLGWSPLPRVHE